jgi:hypothetical protein
MSRGRGRTRSPGGSGNPKMHTPETPEVVVFAGKQDLSVIFASALCCLASSCPWVERVTVVTPSVRKALWELRSLRQRVGLHLRVLADHEVAPEASSLPSWFRQQYLKLSCDRIATTDNLVCLGADTLVLDSVHPEDLFEGSDPIIRYFTDRYPHLDFERGRVANLASALRVAAPRAMRLGDFICDFFPMRAATLRSLRQFVSAQWEGGLLDWLGSLGPRVHWDNRFGEWTLYALFLLDVGRQSVQLRNGSAERWACQIHSANDMSKPDRYEYRILHVATKDYAAPVLADLRAAGRLPALCQRSIS